MNFIPGSTFSSIKPSGILWDMDGVLVDTADAHYQSWLDVLTSLRDQYLTGIYLI